MTDHYPRGMEALTERERTVLAHMMRGLTAVEIAQAEYVTIATVRSHIRSILWKLQVRNQLAAVALGYRSLLAGDVVIPALTVV